MARQLAALTLATVLIALAFCAQAGAGPPASCHRARCDLSYYAAWQDFHKIVLHRLRPGLAASIGRSSGYCVATKHRAPGFARCGVTIEQGELPASCTVEALLSRSRGGPWHVRWWQQSKSCDVDIRAG